MKKQDPTNRIRQTQTGGVFPVSRSQKGPAVQEARNPAKKKRPISSSGRGGGSFSPGQLPQDEIEMRRDEKLRAVEKRRARSRSLTMTLFVLLIMTLTVFIMLQIVRQTAPKPEFIFIQNGTVEHTVGSTGLLIRDETLLKAPAEGTVQPLVEEGDRVSFGQNVAMILAKGQETLLSALKNVEQQISDLQRQLINEGKGPGARVIYEEADEDIAELVNLIRKDSAQDSLLNMTSYETSISVIQGRRDTRLLSIEFSDSRLDALKQQKKELEKSLGIQAGTIVSMTPGIVSYNIDGLEELLTVANIPLLTVSDYSKYIGQTGGYVTTGAAVKAGDPIVRVTKGIYQHIAFLLPDTKESAFPQNSVHTVKDPLDAVSIANCTVIRTMIIGEDLFVIFKTDRQLDRFSDRRTIQADITVSSTEGLKIPFSSILGFDAESRIGEIMIVSDGYTRKAKVRVVDHDRSSAIVEGIEGEPYAPVLNGYLVVNPGSIAEGENIGDTK